MVLMESAPLKVVCGIIVYGGRILATRRDPARHFPLLWEFPGGKIEGNESPEEALHRELLEELDLRVRIHQALEVVEYRSREVDLDLYPFLCRPVQTTAPVPRDHPEMRWIGPGETKLLDWAPPDMPILQSLPAELPVLPD